MASAIDTSLPVAGSPTTASVRANFTTAASEITALQALGLDALTAAEIAQIGNIDSTTISAAQWAYLGASDQALATSDSITHVNFTATGYIYRSVTNSITAGSTQSQAGATALTTEVNIVTVSGTNGDGVKLPSAVDGGRIMILNEDAAQTIKIWPNTSDSIDGGAADAVDTNTLAAGSVREYIVSGVTNWITATPTGGTGDLLAANNLSDVGAAATAFSNIKQAASDTATGVVELATDAELNTGTDTTRAVTPANVEAWTGSTNIASVGTITAGVWTGTDVAVADGGTGVSTLTDGGVLLGSGTGAITAMAVLADGEMIVGDGTTDPVAESGATLRTSIGVAIGTDVLAEGDTSIGKHTIWVPVAAMRPTTSNGCSAITDFETTAGRPDFQVMYFDGAADEHAQFGIAMPKSWNEGTVTFRAFSGVTDTAATDGTDTVSWGLQGLGVADDASVDQAYGTGVVVTEATSSTVEDIAVSAVSSAVTIASAAVDTLTFFRVYRDISADDMTEDAGLIGIQIFITTNAGEDT